MKNRTVLITGASRGIGEAISKRLRLDGYHILAPTRREMDLLSDASIDKYLAALKDPVDILINNAGINPIALIADVSDEDILKTLQVNLLAPLKIVRAVVPGMTAHKYGRIINISSVWGMITRPGRMVYTITKSGLNGMTRSLAKELAPYNILVNAVAPGYVNTELTRQNNTDKDLEKIRQTIPLGRLAEPDDIAGVVAFLSAEENTYITGQVITVDGGLTCRT